MFDTPKKVVHRIRYGREMRHGFKYNEQTCPGHQYEASISYSDMVRGRKVKKTLWCCKHCPASFVRENMV
jgi:hypothetical protein